MEAVPSKSQEEERSVCRLRHIDDAWMTVKNVVMKPWDGLTEEKVEEEMVCADPGAWLKLAYVHINLTPPVSQTLKNHSLIVLTV